MSAIRILHVDDEPDIREVVDLSLNLNPEFAVRGCSSGAQAVPAAIEWWPFVILLDVMMPGIDGPATFRRLHENPQTADIPVLFMTARAQTREIEQLIALGAHGVISKPFDPMTLAVLVQSHLQAVRLDTLRNIFMRRAKADAALLKSCQLQLAKDVHPAGLERMRELARGLAAAAKPLALTEIGNAAASVEEAAAHVDRGVAERALGPAIGWLINKVENASNKPLAALS